MTTEPFKLLSEKRHEWDERAQTFVGKTIKSIDVDEEWTNIVFEDKSMLSIRDNPTNRPMNWQADESAIEYAERVTKHYGEKNG